MHPLTQANYSYRLSTYRALQAFQLQERESLGHPLSVDTFLPSSSIGALGFEAPLANFPRSTEGSNWDGYQSAEAAYPLLPQADRLEPTIHEGYAYLNQLATARQNLLDPSIPQVSATANPLNQAPIVGAGNTAPATQTTATAAAQKINGPRLTDPKDWHIPSLDETFQLAKKYPNKKIYLDTKTPEDPAVGRRLANQIMDLLHKHPELKSRVVIMNPNEKVLDAMKDEFKKRPEFQYFKNFSLDNENLNKMHPSAAERSPLTHSGDNKYVSIGNPKNPLTPNNFQDLVDEVKKAKAQTTDPKNPNYGKKILAWTLNDAKQIEKLVKAGADGILTDDPEKMKQTLDKMGYAPNDPKRPEIIAHRGGPNSTANPENTLPRIEDGLRSSADGIEIDIVSAKDGAVVFHDNDPNGSVGMIRNLGLEADNKWRPIYPDITSPLRGKTLDQLSIDQIRKNYGFERNATSSPLANLGVRILDSVASYPGAWLKGVGDAIGFKPLSAVGEGLNAVVDAVGKPIFRGVMQGVDQVVTGTWHGLTTVGKGLWNGVGNIFKGNVAKGLGQIGTGIWQGGVKLVTGIGKGVWSAVKGVGKAISNVGSAIAKGAKSAWDGVKNFFKKLF